MTPPKAKDDHPLLDHPRFTTLEGKVDSLSGSVASLATAVQYNTSVTEEIAEIITTARSFFRFLGWIGRTVTRFARPLGILAAAATAVYVFVYQLLHGGQLPK